MSLRVKIDIEGHDRLNRHVYMTVRFKRLWWMIHIILLHHFATSKDAASNTRPQQPRPQQPPPRDLLLRQISYRMVSKSPSISQARPRAEKFLVAGSGQKNVVCGRMPDVFFCTGLIGTDLSILLVLVHVSVATSR